MTPEIERELRAKVETYDNTASNFVAFDTEEDYVIFDDGQYKILGKNIRKDLERNLDENFTTRDEVKEIIEEELDKELEIAIDSKIETHLTEFEEENLIFSSDQQFRQYFKSADIGSTALRNSIASVIGGVALGAYTASLALGITFGLAGVYFFILHKAYNRGKVDEIKLGK